MPKKKKKYDNEEPIKHKTKKKTKKPTGEKIPQKHQKKNIERYTREGINLQI